MLDCSALHASLITRTPAITPSRTAGSLANVPRRRPRPSRAVDIRHIEVGEGSGAIRVQIAADRGDFEQAYRLLAVNYQARGYEAPSQQPFRFTPHHILPGTITVVAKRRDRVVATMSQVPDTSLLGLPMESIYGWEIHQLRSQGLRLAEITSLADQDLSPREFLRVFAAMSRLTCQYHHRQGGDSWVITVNPRHRSYYRKVLGFISIGETRSYPNVCDHPAEAFLVDADLMRVNAPRMHREIFGEPLSDAILDAPTRPRDHVAYFAERSTQADRQTLLQINRDVSMFDAPPRWWRGGEFDPADVFDREVAACGS